MIKNYFQCLKLLKSLLVIYIYSFENYIFSLLDHLLTGRFGGDCCLIFFHFFYIFYMLPPYLKHSWQRFPSYFLTSHSNDIFPFGVQKLLNILLSNLSIVEPFPVSVIEELMFSNMRMMWH